MKLNNEMRYLAGNSLILVGCLGSSLINPEASPSRRDKCDRISGRRGIWQAFLLQKNRLQKIG